MRKIGLGLAVAAAAMTVTPTVALAARGDTTLISRSGLFGPVGNGTSSEADMSADGRFVVFDGASTNLDPDDSDVAFDVYVRDTQRGVLSLVSRASGSAGAKGNGESTRGAISADGRFVAFSSRATNLDADDADSNPDCYVRDLEQHRTTLVSRATGVAGAKSDGQCITAIPTDDGGAVLLVVATTNFDAADTDGNLDLYVRDLRQHTTVLASRAAGVAGAKQNDAISGGEISGDGRFVTFAANATNLHPDDGDTIFDVFVRDMQQNTTTLVSRASGIGSVKGSGNSTDASISTDGRYVAFQSAAPNLTADDGLGDNDIFVRDLQISSTTLVSRATGVDGAKANLASLNTAMSRDGRYIGFHAVSTNLSTEDDDAAFDVFVRDTVAKTTTFVSRANGLAGVGGNDDSLIGSISDNGRYVAFRSDANNLFAGDANGSRDVFVRDLRGPAPVALAPPRIAGAAVPGGTLTCFGEAFANGPLTSLTRQWLRNGVVVPGGLARTVTAADVGRVLTCRVVATNAGGSTTAESAPVVIPAAGARGAPGADSPLLALLAVQRQTARASRRARIAYIASAPADVTVTVLRGRKRVARVTGRSQIGRNALQLRKRIRPGRYTVRLRAVAADGEVTSDSGRLILR
jgi:Tol biopolymer transport system component